MCLVSSENPTAFFSDNHKPTFVWRRITMADFMQNLKKITEESGNVCLTENGAVAYKTTGKPLLDLNFKISSMRSMSEADKIKLMTSVYNEDKKLFIKWLFFAGDVREGCGERSLFRAGLKVITRSDPDIAKSLLSLIPEYTRWDNLVVLADNSSIKDKVVEIIKEQLGEDMESMNAGKSVSLLAKWMPSNNTSSAETVSRARFLAKRLGISDREYRKMLSALRKYLDVVEVKLSAKQFGEINYSAVPSKANVKYSDAFLRNDETRRRAFLESLKKGEAKINGNVNFPYDIVHKYLCGGYGYVSNIADDTAEALWKALPDYVKGQGNTICVADGSGSMCTAVGGGSSVTALEVCYSLAIYFAEHSSGQFKDKFITFSHRPKFVDLSECDSLNSKLKEMHKHAEYANTNIEAVFDLILKTAVEGNLSQEEIPNILVLSDMEFDICAASSRSGKIGKKDFDEIKERFKNAGYKLPRLIFWNICSRTGAITVKENEMGVALVSGFSPTVCEMVLSDKLDPWELLLEKINSERYAPVEEALDLKQAG